MGNPPPLPSKTNEEWTAHLSATHAIANEYQADNWDTLVLDIQDVTPLFSDPIGLAILISDHEFKEIEELVETTTIDTTHVYRNQSKDTHYLIIVAEASTTDHAILIPAFLGHEQFDELQKQVDTVQEIHTTLRSPDTDARVTISHDEPAIFF